MGEEITKEVSNDLVEIDINGDAHRVYPEIAEFFAARKTAELEWALVQAERTKAVQDAVYEKKIAAIKAGTIADFDEYSTSRQAERERYEDYRAAEYKYNDFVSAARIQNSGRVGRGNPTSWDLLINSSHKEVKWIAENCIRDNEYEALKILKHLPSTMDELYRVAKDDYEMCGVFDTYFERAKAAGVLRDEDMPASAREWMALSNYIRRNYGGTYIRDLNQRIRPIVKAEVEHALAKAKAEWQGMEEARAENIRRNRSEGAKRAAETRRRNREAVAVNGPHPDVAMENDAVVTPQPEEIPQPHAAAQAAAKVEPIQLTDCRICVNDPERVHRHDDVLISF